LLEKILRGDSTKKYTEIVLDSAQAFNSVMDRFQRSGEIQRSFCDIAAHELGLPIVKEIAKAHGGTISVTSQVDKGSVFTLRLPGPTQQTIPA